jgi:hypothetical protein
LGLPLTPALSPQAGRGDEGGAATSAFVLGEAGQAILMKHGFGRGDPAK